MRGQRFANAGEMPGNGRTDAGGMRYEFDFRVRDRASPGYGDTEQSAAL